uniref:Uncharacterized protein n=1 Tax=Oryza glumipatula TaxID=40148 RepID=A0A0D9YT76_9ORYZ
MAGGGGAGSKVSVAAVQFACTDVESENVDTAERHGYHQGVTVAGGGHGKWEVAPVGSHGETTVGPNDEEVTGDVTSTQDGSSISRHNMHDWRLRW